MNKTHWCPKCRKKVKDYLKGGVLRHKCEGCGREWSWDWHDKGFVVTVPRRKLWTSG